jgi:hypothetical protein
MRKALFLLSLVFFLLAGGRPGQQDTEQTRLGQITLSFRSVLTFSAQRGGTYVEPTFGFIREENETSDRITYTYTMTQRFNVTQIEDGLLMFGSGPETGTLTSSLAIEGGGQESGVRTADGKLVFRIRGSWTYKAPQLPPDFYDSGVYEIVLGKHFRVIPPNPLPLYPEVMCGGTVEGPLSGSSPYETLGLADGYRSSVMNQALDDPGFVKQFEGTAPDNKSGFQVSRQAQFSASGTEEDRDLPGISLSWTGHWDVHYTLSYAPETELEAVIIPPDNYESWLPTGDKDEDTPSLAPLAAKAELRLKNKPGKKPSETAKFKFALIETSKEPGLCLNAPKKDKAKKSFDLKFRQKDNPELEISDDGQTATSKEFVDTDVAVVRSYDWGAYAKLKVTAILDNGKEMAAHLEGKPQQEEMVIPLDENDNRVADGWEKEKNVYGKNLPADWDGAEEPKGQKAPGDGISLYEKYRGFEFEGIHERLDPNHKYLFVHDPDEILSLVAQDERVQAMNFKAVSKLRLRFIDEDHWTGPGSSREKKRIVNFNTGWKGGHAVDQHALDVKLESEGAGVFPQGYLDSFNRLKISLKGEAPVTDGFAFPDGYQGFGAPRRTYQIVIFLALIRKNIVGLSAYNLRSRGVFSSDQDEESYNFVEDYIRTHPGEYREVLVRQITLVLSHEMSHGVGVEHHEEFFSRPPEDCVMSGSYFFGKGGLADPLMLNTFNVIPDKLCLKYCWPSVIVSDLADEKAGK